MPAKLASALRVARLRISTALLNNRRRRRSSLERLVTVLVCVLAGVMIATSSMVSRGGDLRPGRNTDLVDLLKSESVRNRDLAAMIARRQAEVDRLIADGRAPDVTKEIELGSAQAMMTPVAGPGITVALDDAPPSVQPVGVDQDLLVVHQQDIQAVANALWAGGAEAMTIQGQRVISTTGIKCVGNTVVLHGVPYAPPYRITAIGDPERLQAELDADPAVRTYREYVDSYSLGWAVERHNEVRIGGFAGSSELSNAQARR